MAKENISNYYTEENATRIVALQVIIILLLVFFNHWSFLIYILTVDFAVRGFTYLPSPLAFIAKRITNLIGLPRKPIFASPKKFAAILGFVFSLSISIALFLNLENFAFVLGSILVFFAFLDAVFNICVGCYVYNWFLAPIVNKRNDRYQQENH